MKVSSVAYRCFKHINNFFQALGSATYLTFSHMGNSFKNIVFNFHRSWMDIELPTDVYILVLKIGVWVLSMGFCIIKTTARLYFNENKISEQMTIINYYLNKEIDPSHIKTRHLDLDTTALTKEIQVDDLLTIYDQINFFDDKKPGYMAPSSRKEDRVTYTVQELREALKKFVKKVKNREAFIGTPPIWDTPQLMTYYKKIEDAVRLSIYKVNNDMKDFVKKHGTNIESYSKSQLKTYDDLLQNQARVAIDLAIAGKHCGARYMGEAMSIYTLMCGKPQDSFDLNLEDTLVEILAWKRKEIAEKHIQNYLGQDTHKYGSYMSELGPLLQLPGMQNIVEHLVSISNKEHLLKKFFEEYSVNFIIKTIQEEIKTKSEVREKIIDWLKDQVSDWKLEEYQEKTTSIIEDVKQILKKEIPQPSLTSKAMNDFSELLTFLKQNNISLPEAKNFDDFLSEIFCSETAKKWRDSKFGFGLNAIKGLQNMKIKLSQDEQLENQIFNQIQAGCFRKEDFTKDIDTIERILQIQTATKANVQLTFNSLKRAIENESQMEDLIKNQMDLNRRLEFVEQFSLEKIAEDGISQELMEWLLVSNHILIAQ